jgi:hypothetical protein
MSSSSSIIASVPIGCVLDHYRTMLMHRYPSELCEMFQRELPEANRHAPGGTGASLLYHYILHGSRDYDMKVLDVRTKVSELVMCMRIWLTYLHSDEKVHVMTRDAFSAHHETLDTCSYDLAVFDTAYMSEVSQMELMLYTTFLHAWRLLRVGGVMVFEGIPVNLSHHVFSTMSMLYLFQHRGVYEMYTFCPNTFTDKPVQFIVLRKRTNESLGFPMQRPLLPPNYLPHSFQVQKSPMAHGSCTLVVVTSSYKSVGNNNVFTEEARFRQLVESIRTVRVHIPNPYILVAEINKLGDHHVQYLREEGVNEVNVFHHLVGVPKSAAEGAMLLSVCRTYLMQKQNGRPDFAAMCKLSGRYVLLDNFPGYDPTKIMCKRMRPKEIMTRFFSIPASFYARFCAGMEEILQMGDFVNHQLDIEHALGLAFPEMDTASVMYPTIGVGGFYAPTCQVVVE